MKQRAWLPWESPSCSLVKLLAIPGRAIALRISRLFAHELAVLSAAKVALTPEVVYVRACVDPDNLVTRAFQARGRRVVGRLCFAHCRLPRHHAAQKEHCQNDFHVLCYVTFVRRSPYGTKV